MAATERIPNLAEDDLLDAEVGEFLQNYLELSGEVSINYLVLSSIYIVVIGNMFDFLPV